MSDVDTRGVASSENTHTTHKSSHTFSLFSFAFHPNADSESKQRAAPPILHYRTRGRYLFNYQDHFTDFYFVKLLYKSGNTLNDIVTSHLFIESLWFCPLILQTRHLESSHFAPISYQNSSQSIWISKPCLAVPWNITSRYWRRPHRNLGAVSEQSSISIAIWLDHISSVSHHIGPVEMICIQVNFSKMDTRWLNIETWICPRVGKLNERIRFDDSICVAFNWRVLWMKSCF